jgi:hypothetical protein
MKQKISHIMNEFTVVGIFVAIIFIGLLFGMIFTFKSEIGVNLTPQINPPTVVDYRTEARSVLEPFLLQIQSIPSGPLSEETATAMVDLIRVTQERLLRMRVPGEERDAHLALVIILDQWKKAVYEDETVLSGVLERTILLLEKYRWLMPSEENL